MLIKFLETTAEQIKIIGSKAAEPNKLLKEVIDIGNNALDSQGELIEQHDSYLRAMSLIVAKIEQVMGMWEQSVRPVLEIGSAIQEQINTYKDENQISELDYKEDLEII